MSLGQALGELAQISATMRQDGASPAEIERYRLDVLKRLWPQADAPWRYRCDDCQDTGALLLTCKPGQRCNGLSTRTDSPREQPSKYQRLCVKEAAYVHDYMEPCFCQAGQRYRVSTPPPEQDVERAAKVRQPTRVGRW